MTKEIKAEQAHYLKEEILRIQSSMGKGYFLLGELFKKFRDEKLYRLLSCNTMEEFIAQPELACSRSSVYDYIHMHETYIEKLGISSDEIADIKYSKLRKILPVVLSDPEEWIEKARTLSRGDLALEVGEAKTIRETAESQKRPDLRTPLKLNASLGAEKIYAQIVSQCEICPICDKHEDLTPHHFPRTHARGGEEDDWKRIPLCLMCHEEAQVNSKEWSHVNRINIQNWFYGVIKILAERLKEK